MWEIISQVLNLLLASGLVATLLFYRSKARKARAEAESSEQTAVADAIANYIKTSDEWESISNNYKAELATKNKLIDSLYNKQQEDRDIILAMKSEVSEKQIALMSAQIKTCDVRGCTKRNPPNEFY